MIELGFSNYRNEVMVLTPALFEEIQDETSDIVYLDARFSAEIALGQFLNKLILHKKLIELTLTVKQQIKREDIYKLALIPSLTKLVIIGDGIELSAIHLLTQLPNINYLTIDVEDNAVFILAQSQSLKTLNLTHSNITDKCMEALAKNTAFTTLDLNYNPMLAKGVKAFGYNNTLRTLLLSQVNLHDEDVCALQTNNTLTELDVSLNKLGLKGAEYLAKMVSLQVLDIGGNKIGDDGAQALLHNHSIRQLNISDNDLTEVGAKILLDARHFVSLDIFSNPIIYFTDTLFENKHGLKRLIISYCYIIGERDDEIAEITDEAAEQVAQYSTLEEIDIIHNKISDYGIQLLCQIQNLKKLSFSRVYLNKKAIAELLQNNLLSSLIANDCELGDEEAELLARHPSLQELNLNRNAISQVGAQALAQLQSLTSLNLNNNPIGDEELFALAKHTNLSNLYIDNTNITATGIQQLLTNSSLTFISASFNKAIEISNHSIDPLVKQQIIDKCNANRHLLQHVRDEFVCSMVMWAHAKANSLNDKSHLIDIPLEIAIHIFSFINFNYLKKTAKQIEGCVTFIFNTINEITNILQTTEQNFMILEQSKEIRKSNFRLFKTIPESKQFNEELLASKVLKL